MPRSDEMGRMKRYAIVVAGGKGLRMGGELPKQFIPVGGRPILMRTLDTLYAAAPDISVVLVLPVAQQIYWKQLCEEYHFTKPYTLADGGETRFHSVRNGLDKIPQTEEALVAVHDGVRPFVSAAVISACFESAKTKKAVVPVTDVVETIRKLSQGKSVTENRDCYKLVQTPQTFLLSVLKQAYSLPYSQSFTDDASVVEASGQEVFLVPGNRENIKITTPFDLKVANALL